MLNRKGFRRIIAAILAIVCAVGYGFTLPFPAKAEETYVTIRNSYFGTEYLYDGGNGRVLHAMPINGSSKTTMATKGSRTRPQAITSI